MLPTLLSATLRQAENRRLCGRSYCNEYRDYIYVNQLGERIKPGCLTRAFPAIPEKPGLQRLRSHNLHHSCASLL